MASSRLPRAAHLLLSAAGRLRSPPSARAFSGAAGTDGASPGGEGVLAAVAVAIAGSGLGLWLMPPALADSGEAAGGQISVAAAPGAGSTVENREKKGRFLFGGESRAALLPCSVSLTRARSLSLGCYYLRRGFV